MVLNRRLGLTRFEADEYYQQAIDAYKKKDFDKAHDAMTSAIELLPRSSELYAARGFFHLEDGELVEARADFDQALKLYPYEMLAHYGRGVIAYNEKKWAEALDHFTHAFRADQQRPETLYYLALVYHRLGREQDATNVMTRAQQALGQAEDRRARQAERWLREFNRHTHR